MKKIALAACVVLLAACNGRSVKQNIEQTITKAYIFERKMLPGNKLLVSFAYQKGQSVVRDSSVIDNTVLSQDSVPVSLLAAAGGKKP